MNAENEDDFLHRLATYVKTHFDTNLTKRHAAFAFESVHIRSLQIYEYFMMAILWSPYVIGRPYIFSSCDFSFFSSPNLSRRRLDVYHTLAHGVALVRI